MSFTLMVIEVKLTAPTEMTDAQATVICDYLRDPLERRVNDAVKLTLKEAQADLRDDIVADVKCIVVI